MSTRQREVLRALRSREQADAADARRAAQARLDAALAEARALDAEHARASAPPAAGTVTRVDREARRRRHVARVRARLPQAWAQVEAARVALAEAEDAFGQRVRDTQAVGVLDARAAQAERRDATRRAGAAAEERNARGAEDV